MPRRKPGKPGKPGRPSKFTDKVKKAILHALSNGCTRTQASKAAGITLQTFLNWQQRAQEEPEFLSFFEEVEEAEASFIVTLTSALGEIVGNPKHPKRLEAVKFGLERRGGWTQTQRTELTGPGGGPVNIQTDVPPIDDGLVALERMADELPSPDAE